MRGPAPGAEPAIAGTIEEPAQSLGRGRRRVKPSSPVAHLLQYVALRAVIEVLSVLPWSATRALGRGLGAFAARVLHLRWRVALENLSHAFPERSQAERERIARAAYGEIGTTFLELFRHLRPGEAIRRVHNVDAPPLEQLRAGGKGAVLVTGHFGNWELVGAALVDLGWPLTALVATQRNRRVDALVTRMRERAGLKILRTDEGLRPMLRVLLRNEFLCFLNDQDAGSEGRFVSFLGRPASTAVGPARFARLAGCAILCGHSIRRVDGTYDLKISEPIVLREDLPPEEAELEATTRMVAILDALVRTYPEQWFWMHRRWKTRPPGEKELLNARA